MTEKRQDSLYHQVKQENLATREGVVDSMVLEPGHAYLDKLCDENTTIPPPNEEMMTTVLDTADNYGVDTTVLLIVDDTPEDLGDEQLDSKESTATEYTEKWGIKPDQVAWESEVAEILDGPLDSSIPQIPDSNKRFPYECPQFDAAITIAKLASPQTSIPVADFALTQHDENFPLPHGGYSSFHGYKDQGLSWGLQAQLFHEGVLPIPTHSQTWNLEYNPEEASQEELRDVLEEVFTYEPGS